MGNETLLGCITDGFGRLQTSSFAIKGAEAHGEITPLKKGVRVWIKLPDVPATCSKAFSSHCPSKAFCLPGKPCLERLEAAVPSSTRFKQEHAFPEPIPRAVTHNPFYNRTSESHKGFRAPKSHL